MTTLVDPRRTKLAGTVAHRIIEDVSALGWPAGTVIGSEADLLDRYGVSRAVFREAVRLVEHQHVAHMRRGPGGGLVVDEADPGAVMSATILYLARVDARLDEVFDARTVLEEIVAELAPGRLQEKDIAALRQHIAAERSGEAEDHRRLHTLLAEAARNPALDLFVECLNRVATFYVLDRGKLTASALDQSIHAHDRIASAIIANKPDLARGRMRKHLRAEEDYIRRHLPAERRMAHAAALEATLGDKRGEAVARRIFAAVIDAQLRPGAFIGSETDLMDRYDASRAVFREAVRILEHHHVALMRRGPRGGLFVAEPSTTSVADTVAVYLRRRGVTLSQLSEVRVGIELAIVDLVCSGLTEEGRRVLQPLLDRETEQGHPGALAHQADLHSTLASLSGNRALELVAIVLHRLAITGLGVAGLSERRAEDAEARTAHRAIVEAVLSGDRELARHRMRAHLLHELTALSTQSS